MKHALLLALIPIAAYMMLAAAHAIHMWKHRTEMKRGFILIESAIFAAYGLMTTFYVIEGGGNLA